VIAIATYLQRRLLATRDVAGVDRQCFAVKLVDKTTTTMVLPRPETDATSFSLTTAVAAVAAATGAVNTAVQAYLPFHMNEPSQRTGTRG